MRDLPVLNAEEQRVLGSLLEKEITVPGSYPMTVNSVRTACNQSSSRDPIVEYDERVVHETLRELKSRDLAAVTWEDKGRRTLKYLQTISVRLDWAPNERALLTVLLLRGAQPPGALKTRTERLHSFADRAALKDAPNEGDAIEDERRLAYVAFTRASERLVVLCTQGRRSRFLDEALAKIEFAQEELPAPEPPSHDATLSATVDTEFQSTADSAGDGPSSASSEAWADKLREIRALSPQAYERWTDDEDARLTRDYQAGKSVVDLAKSHQRRPSAIRSRLKKLGLIAT